MLHSLAATLRARLHKWQILRTVFAFSRLWWWSNSLVLVRMYRNHPTLCYWFIDNRSRQTQSRDCNSITRAQRNRRHWGISVRDLTSCNIQPKNPCLPIHFEQDGRSSVEEPVTGYLRVHPWSLIGLWRIKLFLCSSFIPLECALHSVTFAKLTASNKIAPAFTSVFIYQKYFLHHSGPEIEKPAHDFSRWRSTRMHIVKHIQLPCIHTNIF